jgi:hypothetical protein
MGETLDDLKKSIFSSKVSRARRASQADNLAAGAVLFDDSIRLMRSAIRCEHPSLDEAGVMAEVRRRLAIARRLDEAGLYRDASPGTDGKQCS